MFFIQSHDDPNAQNKYIVAYSDQNRKWAKELMDRHNTVEGVYELIPEPSNEDINLMIERIMGAEQKQDEQDEEVELASHVVAYEAQVKRVLEHAEKQFFESFCDWVPQQPFSVEFNTKLTRTRLMLYMRYVFVYGQGIVDEF